MKRPRPLPTRLRAERRRRREQRRWDEFDAVDPAVTRRSVRRARAALVGAVAGLVVAVVGASWFASAAGADELRWGLGLGWRYSGGLVADIAVSRQDLVCLAAVVAALPVAVAVVGLLRTPARARPGRRAATSTSGWGYVAMVLTLGAAPNVLGCYAVSHAVGPDSELMLLPMIWPQLGFFVLFFGAAWALTRRRTPRTRRTLSGTKVPVR